MGATIYKVLSTFKDQRRPFIRADGRWVFSDICAASFVISLDHALVGIENDALQKCTTFIFEANDRIEADIDRFMQNAEIPIRTFLDSFFSLKHLLRARALANGQRR
jgi:hypothetical protein